jgi:putative addiction module component (TIGR02574 family)
LKAAQCSFRKELFAMKKITVADTLELSLPERIQLVEDIWDTIAEEADSLELTEEEKKIIDERLDAYHNNPDAGSPWTEVFKRITAQHGV